MEWTVVRPEGTEIFLDMKKAVAAAKATGAKLYLGAWEYGAKKVGDRDHSYLYCDIVEADINNW